MLESSGVPVTPEELIPIVYIPELRGSLQTEISSASRRYGRLPYEIDSDFSGLLRELTAGRPVLVLQNLGTWFAPAWHYAVVIGYIAEQSKIILRSGTTRRLIMSAGTFERSWGRSDYWGIVLLEPGDIPASVDSDRYLRSVAAAESAGQLDLALAAYTAAANRWPGKAVTRLGIGNTLYAKGDVVAAEIWYRRFLALQPGDPVGINNLATVLSESGRCDEAEVLIRNALAIQPEHSAYLNILRKSEIELQSCRPAQQ